MRLGSYLKRQQTTLLCIRPCIDYGETFALMEKIITLKHILVFDYPVVSPLEKSLHGLSCDVVLEVHVGSHVISRLKKPLYAFMCYVVLEDHQVPK